MTTVVTRNLSNNPRAAVNLTDLYSFGPGTLSRVASGGPTNSPTYGAVTEAAGQRVAAIYNQVPNTLLDIDEQGRYTFSVYAYSNSATPLQVGIFIAYDVSNPSGSGYFVTPVSFRPLVPNTWMHLETVYDFSLTSAASSVNSNLQVGAILIPTDMQFRSDGRPNMTTGTPFATSKTLYMTGLTIVENDREQPLAYGGSYFDGSTTPSANVSYSWDGASGNSQSKMTRVIPDSLLPTTVPEVRIIS